jgi:hypothetical protein
VKAEEEASNGGLELEINGCTKMMAEKLKKMEVAGAGNEWPRNHWEIVAERWK